MANIETLSIQFNANGVPKAVKNIQAMGEAVRKLGDAVKAVETAKLGEFAEGMKNIKAGTPTPTQADSMERFASAIVVLSAAIGGIDLGAFAQNLNATAEAANSFKKGAVNNIKGLGDIGKEAEKAAEKINKATAKSSQEGSNTPTDDQAKSVDTIVKGLEKVEVKTSKIKSMFKGLYVPTKQFKSLEEQAEKIAAKYEKLRDKIQKALDSGKYTEGSSKYKEKMAELEAIQNEYDRLIQKQKELAQEGGDYKINPNIGRAFGGIKQAVGGVKQAFEGIGSIIKTANSHINTFISKIRSLGSAAKKTKNDTTSLTDRIKKLSNELLRLSKMMKLMITRKALRAVITEVGNGFKSLALHSQEFDNTMSNLINSSKTLGYSVSGMAGQLINALAPVLLKIIELVTRAVNALNQLFSALRGASTWNKAKDFTGSWSDSIKEANGAAKELKKTVLGFDELNQLQDNKNKGGGGAGITDMFEDVPIDPWFKDLSEKIKKWAEKLFDPIKKAWDKVGKWVKDKWKYALNELVKLGSSVARDFWKVWEQPETEQIFKNVFITIGEIGRAVGNLAKQFRKAWDSNDTGLHILEHIRNIILIITNHIRNMATATADWAANLDFEPLLTSIEEWLGSLEPVMDAIMGILEDFYKEVVLKFTKWVIESGLPDLIRVFKRFNDEVKWEDLRSKLNELWKHLEPFMETVGEGLIIFIDRVAQAIAKFINGEKFEEFLQFIEDWMDSVTPEDVADGIEKLVKAIAGLKIAGVVVGVLSAFTPVFSGLIAICKGLGAIASGVSTFVGALGGLGTGLLPVIGVVAALVIVLYSFVESYGGFEGAYNKLKEVVGQVTGYFKTLAEKIKLIPSEYSEGQSSVEKLAGAFSDLKDALGDAKGLWDALFTLIVLTINTVGTVALPILKGIIDVVTEFVEKLSGAIKQISGLFDMLFGWISGDSERVNKGKNSFLEGFVGATTGDKDLVGLVKGITNGYDELNRKQEEATSLANLLSESQDGVSTSLGLLGQYQRDSASSLDTYKGSLDGVKTKQEEVASTTDTLSGKNSSFSDTLKTLSGLHKDAQSTFKTHNDVIRDLQKTTDETTKSYSDSVEEVKKVIQYTEGYQKTTEDLEKVLSTNKDALGELRTAVNLVTDANKGMVEYTPEAEKALQDLQDIMKSTGDEAEKTGEHIVEGIQKPLEEADPKSSIQIFKDTFIGCFETLFGIASPAKEMYPIGNNILLGIDEGFKEMFKDFDATFTDFYDNHVKTWFDKDKWSFSGVAEGLKSTFESAKEGIGKVWNSIADGINGEHEIGSSKIKINLPKFKYAKGGFPEDGLFMANHNELVGTFSNGKTAVANNAQIVEGIERGVYSAVSSAMANNSSGSSYISNEIVVDGEVIARSVTRAQEKINRRYSPQTV